MNTHTLLERASLGDDENRGPRLLITGITLMVIAVLVLSGRIYCRAVLLRRMGSDDWCMILATMVAIPILVTNCIAVMGGVGRHTWKTSVEAQKMAVKMGYVAMMHYFLALGLTKCSLLLFLIRLAPSTRLSKISWGIFYFVVAFTIAAFILSAIQCVPASFIWEVISEGNNIHAICLPQRPLNFSLFPINIFTDVLIWLLPLRTIWSIQMPLRQKLVLLVIFSMGSMSVLAGILRLSSVETSLTTTDPMWDNLNLGIWSLVEVLIGIICGSAPAIKPLFSKFLPGLLGSSNAISDNSNNPNYNSRRSKSNRHSRHFPGSLSRQQTAYALGSLSTRRGSVMGDDNTSTERFGPRTRIEGPRTATKLDTTSETASEEYLRDGDREPEVIMKSTEVHVDFEERV